MTNPQDPSDAVTPPVAPSSMTTPSGKRRILALVLSVPLIFVALIAGGVVKGVLEAQPHLAMALEGAVRFVLLAALFWGVLVKAMKFHRVRDLGITALNPQRTRALLTGLGLAAAMVLVSVATAVIVGDTSLTWDVQGPAAWGGSFFRTAGGVAFEELAFRCAWMALLWPLLPRKVIVPLAALPFVLLHGGNDGAALFGLANAFLLTLIIGVLFFWRDDGGPDWWGALGFHFAWNFGLALAGSAVSGEHRSVLLRFEGGDALWSGGAFGLEASAATTVGALAALLLALALHRRRRGR